MKVAFHTLGCKVNSYETQAISEQFSALGFEIVDYTEPADVYVINTCSVTAEAARKSRQILNRAKKRNADALTVATGCYAQEDAERLSGSADLIIGNNEKAIIAELVMKRLKESRDAGNETAGVGDASVLPPEILVDDLTRCYDYEEQEISAQGDHVRAFVKIQDGCNRFCSYCIIPYLRGRSRSRRPEDVIKEVKRLADAGFKEIVLTGIDISDYRLPSDAKEGESLIALLKELDGINGIERIRLGSLEEGIVTETFIREAKGITHLCPQFHLSLQSGSDSVLKRMNRKYTTAQYEATVDLLRTVFDRPAITTDIIVGFPGETEEEFEETLQFVKKIGFSAVHVFKYSRREGTVADRMKEQLTDKVKTARSEQLIRLAAKEGRKYRESFLGQTRPVLFEEQIEIDGEKFSTGFTPEYFKIRLRSDENLTNQILPVVISEERLHDKN